MGNINIIRVIPKRLILDEYIDTSDFFLYKNGYLRIRKDISKGNAELVRAYVQLRGSEFHTRNARSRQLQEQRRAKAQR